MTTSESTTIQNEIDRLTEELFGKLPTNFTPPPNAIDSLTSSQKKEVDLLQKRTLSASWYKSLLPNKDIEYLMNDPVTYMRHLAHFGWNHPDTAFQKLKAMAEWRVKERPQDYTFESLGHAPNSKLGSVYGFDKQYRPIIYIHLKNLGIEKNWDSKENMYLKYRLVAFTVERALERMRMVHPNVYQFNFLIDCEGCPLSLSFAREAKDLFLQLGEYHVERLNASILVNCSWTISMVWSMVSYFLPEILVKRYNLFTKPATDPEVQKLIRSIIDPNANGGSLLKYFGGPVEDPFDYQKMLKWDQLKRSIAE